MIVLGLCRKILLRLLVIPVIISILIVPSAFCQESEDSQVFIAGFDAYQQKNYASSIEKMTEVLQKHPDTPLRDMALFWLARSYFKAGNQQEAARYLSQFSKEYPDNSLKNTVEDELLSLLARYEKGEKLPSGPPAGNLSDRQTTQKVTTETSGAAAPQKAVEEKTAEAKAEYREKAIGQYKAIIEKFPASTAALTSAVKLRELGIAVAAPASGNRIFEEAAAAYRQGDCRTALELLDRFLADNSESLLAADANLYKADCYLKLSAQ